MNKFYSGANEYVLKTGDSMTGKLSAPDISTDVYPSINTQLYGVIKSPYSGTFIATDYESQTQNSINETLDKINNFQHRVLDETFIDGILSIPTVKCETISDSRSDSIISMNHTDITISHQKLF